MAPARTGTLRLIWLVAKRDYLRTVRRRGYVFGTLLLPVGVAALMAISTFFSVSSAQGSPSGGGGAAVVVVNDSGLAIPDDLASRARIEVTTDEDAARRLADGAIAEYYRIPAAFEDGGTVLRVQPDVEASLSRLGAHGQQEDVLQLLLRATLLRQAGVSATDSARILQGVTFTTIDPAGEEASDLGMAASIAVPMIFVGLFMISIFITSGYLLQSVTEEKENRVVEIVLSSIPPLPLMGGKIIGLGGAGLSQVGIWVLTGLIALPLLSAQAGGLTGSIDPLVVVLALAYFVLGYLAYGAIFAAIGAIAPGNREAQQYSGFLGFFAAIPFILFAVFLTDIDSTIVVALSIIPLTAPTSMLLVLGLSETIPWPLVGASLVSLGLFAVLATWTSARIFRATVLLYGVRPSLRSLLAAVRSPR